MFNEFTPYFASLYNLFKAEREEIRKFDEYKLWQDYDVPPTIKFEAVPDEWRTLIKKPSEIRDLIFCVETGLANVYETTLYTLFQKYNVNKFSEELLMATPRKYAGLIDILHGHLSTDGKVAGAFHWFVDADASTAHKEFQLEHKKMIREVSQFEISDNLTTFFSDLYLKSLPLKVRKFLGEEYTPIDVVDFILDGVGYTPDKDLIGSKLLDPATGVGIFLTRALKRIFESYKKNSSNFVSDFSENIPLSGVDFKLFSAKATQLNFYLHFLIYAGTSNNFLLDAEFPRVVHHGNALLHQNALSIVLDDHVDALNSNEYEYIVGNPPYLRIQNIKPDSLKKYYVENYRAAEGRFDLSFLFIERGLECLKTDGKLGYITTNKFMTVGAGSALRSLITQRSGIELLVDLGDTEFFNSAVLPCIIILDKATSNKNELFPYAVVTKLKNKEKNKDREHVDLFDFLRSCFSKDFVQRDITITNQKGQVPVNVKSMHSIPPQSNGDTWHFLTPIENEIISCMTNKATTTLKGLADKIMVGIKSTADNVFIKPMTESFVNARGIERELVHPILRGKNIKRWKISWSPEGKNDRYVLYPHKKVEGKLRPINLDEYPATERFLKENYNELSSRKYVLDAGRQWYEIWVTQNPDFFEKQYKILTPDFSTKNTFAIDNEGFYLGTSALAIILENQDELFNYYILGILNSALYEFFHKFKSSTFIYAGRYRYWSSYMEKYPIYDYCKTRVDKALCEGIAWIAMHLSKNESNRVQLESDLNRLQLESDLNRLVYQLFNISEEHAAYIEMLLC